MTSKHDEQIVAKIIEQIEQNKVLPWQCGYLKEGLPRNFVTGRGYHGRNLLMLFCANYNRSGFMTYAQAKKLGGQVRKGEHGFPIVYAESGRYIENEEGKKEWKHGCAKLYHVFNVAQIDGLPETQQVEGDNPDIEKFIAALPVEWNRGRCPSFCPEADTVQIPLRGDYDEESVYYSTLFHELIHWSGAEHRLNREMSTDFGDNVYSREELVAELGAAIMCGRFGIDCASTMNKSASYLDNWLKVIKEDAKVLIDSAKKAEEAVEYLLGLGNIAVHPSK